MEFLWWGLVSLVLIGVCWWLYSNLQGKSLAVLQERLSYRDQQVQELQSVVIEKDKKIDSLEKENRQLHVQFAEQTVLLQGQEKFFQEKIISFEKTREEFKEAFKALSHEALSVNSEEFLKLAQTSMKKQSELGTQELQNKKELIDQTLDVMRQELSKVQILVTEFEKDREKKFGEIKSQYSQLHDVTQRLQVTLASPTSRGQWGEKMAEDVLQAVGMVKGINYLKQETSNETRNRPDYTFLFPNHLKLNMDVKFPLENYQNYCDAQTELEKLDFKDKFFKDVRRRLKEILTREYINLEEGTLPYVLVFIPNERLYAFILQEDPCILEEALKSQVVLCSPLTLYSFLLVIRQSVDSFQVERRAHEILRLLNGFYKQWNLFIESFTKMGKKIEELQLEYQFLVGTRRQQLERQLSKIEDIKAVHDEGRTPSSLSPEILKIMDS